MRSSSAILAVETFAGKPAGRTNRDIILDSFPPTDCSDHRSICEGLIDVSTVPRFISVFTDLYRSKNGYIARRGASPRDYFEERRGQSGGQSRESRQRGAVSLWKNKEQGREREDSVGRKKRHLSSNLASRHRNCLGRPIGP